MKIWAGWTLNHRKPSSAPMISAQRSARFGWVGRVEQGDEHVGDEGDRDRPARQAVEPVGDVDAVARRDDRERPEQHVEPRLDGDRADERHRDGRDRVRLLDLPRRDERHDRQPDELLAGADPLAGLGVQVVVERAEQADPGQRRQRRERRRVRLAQEEVDAEHDDDDEQPAHRRRALLDEVALGPLLADALAEPERLQQPDVRRHQDHDEREREQQALDQLDGAVIRRPRRARAGARRRAGRARCRATP